MSRLFRGRSGFLLIVLLYFLIVMLCVTGFIQDGDLSLGRNPWSNFLKTAKEFAYPSFLDVWFGNPELIYRSDDGTVLRTENRRLVEQSYLLQVASAAWVTFKIATLGSLLGALMAMPFGILSASIIRAPKLLKLLSVSVLNFTRAIHTLVFGLVLVGIVGLGPMAGILAIALHSMGTYGKLFAESLETLDEASIEAIRGVGATPVQVFFWGVWPSILPQWVSAHLYVWEFNIRDSTILGLIGAGGLGLLISESVSLFQWSRLATLLIVVVALVVSFDALSRRIRQALL